MTWPSCAATGCSSSVSESSGVLVRTTGAPVAAGSRDAASCGNEVCQRSRARSGRKRSGHTRRSIDRCSPTYLPASGGTPTGSSPPTVSTTARPKPSVGDLRNGRVRSSNRATAGMSSSNSSRPRWADMDSWPTRSAAGPGARRVPSGGPSHGCTVAALRSAGRRIRDGAVRRRVTAPTRRTAGRKVPVRTRRPVRRLRPSPGRCRCTRCAVPRPAHAGRPARPSRSRRCPGSAC